MANPNRTVARFRKAHPFATCPREEAARLERNRAANPELWRIMEAVSGGQMTADDAVRHLEALKEQEERKELARKEALRLEELKQKEECEAFAREAARLLREALSQKA